MTSTHEEELPGSRGTANFALRWHKDSKMAAHLNVHEIEKEVKTKAKDILRSAYTAEDEGKFIGIVGFDCRGHGRDRLAAAGVATQTPEHPGGKMSSVMNNMCSSGHTGGIVTLQQQKVVCWASSQPWFGPLGR